MKHLLGILPLLCLMAPSEGMGAPSAVLDQQPAPPTPPASEPAAGSEPASPAGSPDPAAGPSTTSPDAPPEKPQAQTGGGALADATAKRGPSDEDRKLFARLHRSETIESLARTFHASLLANSTLAVGRGLTDPSEASRFAEMAFAQAEAHMAEREKRQAS